MVRFSSLVVVLSILGSPLVSAQPTQPPPGGPGLPPPPGLGGLGALGAPPGVPPPGGPAIDAPGTPPPGGPAAPGPRPAPGAGDLAPSGPPPLGGTPPPTEGTPPAADAATSPEFVLPPPLVLPPGDTVTLKTGKTLSNVQVLKTTLTEIHIQTLYKASDLPPLVIPRQYVQSVEYDDYDPNMAALQQNSSQQTRGLMSGFEVSKEMGEKLNTKLDNPPLNFQNRDLVDVLAELSKNLAVTIEVSDEVKAMAPQARMWTFQTNDEITLSLLLQEKLPEKFPELTAEYQFDRIIVKHKAAGTPAESTPADAPATPAPATPNVPAAPPALNTNTG